MNPIVTKTNLMIRVVMLFTLLILSSCAGTNAQKSVLSQGEKNTVITSVSKLLNDHYVFPDVARKTSEHLHSRLESGAYSNSQNIEQFALVLTDDILLISDDSHIRIRPLRKIVVNIANPDPEDLQIVRRRQEKQDNYGLRKVEVLDGNVGYLKMDHFSDHDSAREHVSAMMTFLSHVDALIIDLRANIGGNSAMLRYFSSYFLEPETLLRKTHTRNNAETKELWTLAKHQTPKLYDVPLYILTSKETASAAEAFAFILKEYERGATVGEKTAGMASPGREFRVNSQLKIFVPTKHFVGPVSGTNWAGTGVLPDLSCSSERAFDDAYLLAKKSAANFGDNKTKAMLADIKNSVAVLNQSKEIPGDTLTSERVQLVLDELIEKWALDESAINDMGYRYLQYHDNPTVARYIFSYNKDLHPQSSNVYSSLADAYVELGLEALAITNYQHAILIDADDEYSAEMLSRLSQ